MLLRKFVIAIVSQFDPKGFKQAEDAGERLVRLTGRVDKGVSGVEQQHKRSGDAAARSADRQQKAAAKTEQQFRKVVAAAEKKAQREDAAAQRTETARIKAAIKATRAEIKAYDRAAAARERDAIRAAQVETRQAQRAAQAQKRAAMQASAARRSELAKLERAEKRSNEAALKSRDRINKLLIESDRKAFARRERIAERAAREAAARRGTRREIGGELLGAAGGLGRTVAAGAGLGIAGLGALGQSVISTGVNFESLRAQLKTVEGSVEGASEAFGVIQDFTKKTPFQLDQVTRAFVTLRVRGVDVTADKLTSLGDLSSAFGQTIEEMTDSIAAAARGELDPIEKFGIAGKIAGDKIRLSFKGQTVEVERSATAVTDALVAFGKMQGVQGAMADQSATATGMLSNLADSVSIFFDTVANLGVLDAFKGLLGDIAEKFSDGEGFAKILADALIVVIEGVREFVQDLTAGDIETALNGIREFAEGLMAAFRALLGVMDWLIEKSGGVGEGFVNITLLAYGLVAALSGPGGIVLAAGAVGVAMGRMIADWIADWTGLNDAIASTDVVIADLNASISNLEQRIALIQNFQKKSEQRGKEFEAGQKARAEKAKAELGKTTAGLGAGLAKDIEATDAERIAELSKRDAALGRAALLTAEGQVVVEAVSKAERKRVQDAETRARKEARKRGQDAEAAAAAARTATLEANRQTRQKAFETAQATFLQTGSAEAAAAAATGQVGKVKGAAKGKKGGKAEEFFDFEKAARAAAKRQGETFAETELQRLALEGITGKEAIAMAQAAGKQRAKELEQRFMEAGRIFDASADNILDILGLRGPGSMLEGRPPPQTLIITIAPQFTMIGQFVQNVENVSGAKALEEITGSAGEAAVATGLEQYMALAKAMIDAEFKLQGNRLLKANGGGQLPMGPEG